MYTKILAVGWMAFALAGAVAAELPSTESKVEGSGPSNRGASGSPHATSPEGSVTHGGDQRGAGSPTRGSGTLKDPIELCEKLAGVEREICLRQAQQNRERSLAPGIGPTPGRGSSGESGDERAMPGTREGTAR